MPRDTLKHYRVNLITTVLILGGIAGQLQAAPDRDSYSAGDTRIVNIDPTGCHGVTLTIFSDSSFVNATLYALSRPPSLDARDDMNHSIVNHVGSQKQFLSAYFYLYPGSNVSVNACTHGGPYFFSIIKGIDNFTLWQNGNEGKSVVAYSCTVADACKSDPVPSDTCRTSAWPRKITAADDWYFAASTTNPNVNLYLQRYEYQVENSAILSSCIAGGSNPESCTVAKTPDTSTYLLKVGSGGSSAIVEASTACASDAACEGPNAAMITFLVLFIVGFFLLAYVIWSYGVYAKLRDGYGRIVDRY